MSVKPALPSWDGTTWHNPKGSLAPIAWYGGKYYLAEWIIGQFPPHRLGLPEIVRHLLADRLPGRSPIWVGARSLKPALNPS